MYYVLTLVLYTHKDVLRDLQHRELGSSPSAPDSEHCQVTGKHVLWQLKRHSYILNGTSQIGQASTTGERRR